MTRFKNIFFALTRSERISFVAAGLLVAGSAAALVVFRLHASTRILPAPGGEYREGAVGQPAYVNPVLAASEVDKALVRLTFSSLTDLADKIESGRNGRTWNVRLKENLVWSNNVKLTSDDVIFTVQTIQNPESQSPFFSNWQGVVVNRVSELEMQFNLATPYAFFNENLEDLYVLPKHLFAETPPANWRLSEYNLKPIGSGPYQFDAYEKKPNGFITSYRVVRNPRYFRAAALIDDIVFRFFPSTDELLRAFNAASVDGLATFDPAIVEKINRPYRLIPFDLPSYYAVFLNQSQHLALKEPGVRQALDAAIPKGAIVREVFGGNALVAEGPLSPFFFPPNPQDAPFSAPSSSLSAPPSAAELLENAGWTLTASGTREKIVKNATIPLEFDLTVPRISFLEATARMLQEAWQNIGVRVTVVTLPPEEIANRVIKNREYQALLFGNVVGPGPDLYSFWHSSERFYPGLNLALYHNQDVDDLIETTRTELDLESRAQGLRELQTTIVNDYPALFLYSPEYLHVVSKELKGVTPGPIEEPSDRFRDAATWHLRTARMFK